MSIVTRVGSWWDVDTRFFGVLRDVSLFFRCVFNLLPRRKRPVGHTRDLEKHGLLPLVQILGLTVFTATFLGNPYRTTPPEISRNVVCFVHALLLHHRMFTPRLWVQNNYSIAKPRGVRILRLACPTQRKKFHAAHPHNKDQDQHKHASHRALSREVKRFFTKEVERRQKEEGVICNCSFPGGRLLTHPTTEAFLTV